MRRCSLRRRLLHVVYRTKGGRAVIRGEVRDELERYTGGPVREAGGKSFEIAAPGDHAHLLVSIGPAIAVAKFIGFVKANSSRWVSRRLPRLGDFAWQVGYASFTVSESVKSRVAEYIRNQDAHHRRRTFAEELAALLEWHGAHIGRRLRGGMSPPGRALVAVAMPPLASLRARGSLGTPFPTASRPWLLECRPPLRSGVERQLPASARRGRRRRKSSRDKGLTGGSRGSILWNSIHHINDPPPPYR